MTYINYEYYSSLYGDKAISEADFNRLSWEACKKIDAETSGIDGVRKLRVAFPINEDDVEAVKRCVCKLIQIANEIEKGRENAGMAKGFTQREDGSLLGKVISSISAGNESISYSTALNNTTLLDKAISDRATEKQLFNDAIKEYLSGVSDANGVNLLYMGQYPRKN